MTLSTVSFTDYARVFPEAQTVLREFFQMIDRQAPGLILDAYIAGGLALGDARPGKSDIDIVMVRPDMATNETSMAALAPVVERLRTMYPEPELDGIVLSRADLLAGPAAIEGPRPVISEGRVELREGGGARNPVIWHVLRQGGITWRGAPLAELDLPTDDALLRSWVRDNLEIYWRPWLARSSSVMSRGGMRSLTDDFVEWGVLGVTRLHATLATGEILSKTGAGEYAVEHFHDYWHKIVREALDIRTNPERTRSLYRRDPLGRRKEARDYVAMVIEDALTR